MAGLEADISHFKQPLPVSPLDMAKNIAATRSAVQQNIINDISIDKQKLELMNTQFGLMNNELANLIDSGASKPQAAERMTKFATTLKLPPDVVKHMMDELNAAPDVKTWATFAIRRGMDTMQKYNTQFGVNQDQTDNANNYQGVRASPEKGGGFTPTTRMPVQLPPTTPSVDNQRMLPNGQPNPAYGQPGFVGPSGPPGVVPVPRARPGLPVQPPAAEAPVSGPTGPTERTDFDGRFGAAFPQKPVSGLAPGVAGAIAAVGEQSGKDYAVDLNRAKNFQSDLYPAQAALQGIKELGTQGVGPGTEPLNQIKSAIITWLPNADKKLIDEVGTFEQTRKYLTQIARSSGATGTNDQLAAAFEANPSIKMSNAATENVLKSVIALRKMQHAQTLLFGQQGLPPSEYSQWISKNQNVLDPRAFGFDIMDSGAKNKLLEGMASKDKSGNWIAKKGKEKEFQKFEQSLSFANDAGLIEPPGRR